MRSWIQRRGRHHEPAEQGMYRRILIPVDLSKHDAAVLAAVVRLADRRKCEVMLLHVIERVRGLDDEEMSNFYETLKERADMALADWAGQLERAALESRRQIVVGRRGPEIVRFANEESCDLIVLSSHAADPNQPGWGIGSVSHQVALAAPCSVLLVR